MGQRIVTGVVAGAAFLALLALGGWYYSLMLAALALIGYHEFVKLNKLPANRPDVLLGFAAALVLALPRLPFGWSTPSVEAVCWVLMFALLSATVFSKNKITLDQSALLFVGAFYIGLGFRYMALTREMPHGMFWPLLVFFCIWASDAGAYFVGKAIGRTKLWPSISPNKTVEGALGGLVIALLVSLVFAVAWPDWIGYGTAIAVAIAAAVAGQLGDLIQSAYKRLRGVKDSGSLLPGHGGVLDRTDSWLIVFPLIHLLGLI